MWLSDIIVRCLAKRPAERFQSAAMLLDALNAGRSSGAQEQVSAERVAKKLSEEATVVLQSSEQRRALASSATPAVRTEAKPAAPARSSGGRWPLLLFLGLAGGAAAWLLLGKSPVLIVENKLVEPIRVVLGADTYEVPAGGSAEHKVKGKGPLVAQWYLVRPTGPGGQPLGIELQGRISEPDPKGTITVEVGASSADTPVFAPLVTNATDQLLGIIVNAGTVNAAPCDCRVNPGSTRARIGYYPLFLNSTVQATTSGGGVATFRDLGPQVDRTTGTVGLRFEAKDFPH
jgi:hypothetical protein